MSRLPTCPNHLVQDHDVCAMALASDTQHKISRLRNGSPNQVAAKSRLLHQFLLGDLTGYEAVEPPADEGRYWIRGNLRTRWYTLKSELCLRKMSQGEGHIKGRDISRGGTYLGEGHI